MRMLALVLSMVLLAGMAVADPVLPVAPKATPTAPKVPPAATPTAPAAPAVAPAATPTVQTFSLEQCLRRSLEGNPDLLAARARIDQATKAVELAYVPNKATLSTTFSYQHTLEPVPRNGLASFFSSLIPGLGSSNTSTPSAEAYYGTMVLQQTITTFGRVRWTGLAKKLSEKQAKQDYRTSIETLLLNVEQAYVTVQLSEDQLKLASSRVDNHREFLRLSQNLFKAGKIAEFEVIQSSAALQSALQSLLDAQQTRDTSKVVLAVLMGMPPLTSFQLEEVRKPSPPPQDIEPGLTRALQRRPELAGLRWSLASAQANVVALALSSSPTLSAFSQYGGTYVPVTPVSISWVAGMQLSIPILDGGQSVYLAQQGQAVADEIRQNLASTERSVKQDVAQNYLSLKSYWGQLQQAQVAADQNDEMLKIAFTRFRAGVSSGTELINSQDNWAGARQTLLSVQASYFQYLANWRRSISDQYPLELPESMMVDWELPPADFPADQEPSEDSLNPPTTPASRKND